MRVVFGRWKISDRSCPKSGAPACARRSILQNLASRARKTIIFLAESFGPRRSHCESHHDHSGRKVSPECEISYPLRVRLPITKCRSETDVPLRQNACNFWPLRIVCVSTCMKINAPAYVEPYIFSNRPSRADEMQHFQLTIFMTTPG